jgi:hypothetical protein
VSLERTIDIDARVEVLAADELELLADANLELADRYERGAAFMEDHQGQRLALALSRWRRHRGRYFRELSAEAERIESPHLEWTRACLGPGSHQLRSR